MTTESPGKPDGGLSLFAKVKEATNHTLIYGLGAALQSALNFLFIPLFTHYYTTDMYGVLALVTICGTVAGTLFCFGAPSALARSYYDSDDSKERRRVVGASFLIATIGAVLQIGIGVIFGKAISIKLFHSSQYAPLIRLAVGSAALSSLNNLSYMVLRFKKYSRQVVALNIISLILTAGVITYLLVISRLGVAAPVWGEFLSETVMFFILIFFIRDTLTLDCSEVEVKSQLWFGLQIVAMSAGYYALDWINRYMINAVGSLSEVGIYSLGAQLSVGMNVLFIAPFSQIWAPMRMQYRKDRNADEFQSTMLTYYLAVGLLVAATISLFAKEVISLFAGHKEYAYACRVIPLLTGGYLIYGMISMVDYGLYLSRRGAYYAIALWMACGCSVALNLLFARRFGYVTSAGIIVFSYTLATGFIFFISQKMYPIRYEERALRLFFIGVATLVAEYVIDLGQGPYGILFKGVAVMVMSILFFSNVLYESERNKLINLFGPLWTCRKQCA